MRIVAVNNHVTTEPAIIATSISVVIPPGVPRYVNRGYHEDNSGYSPKREFAFSVALK